MSLWKNMGLRLLKENDLAKAVYSFIFFLHELKLVASQINL